MFRGAVNLTGNLSGWDTSKITTMNATFYQASGFNLDVSSWDVSKVVDFRNMFYGASSFNQDLSSWKPIGVGAVANFGNILNGTNLSVYNYNQLLDQRSQLPLVNGATAVAFGAATKYGGCETNAQAGIDGHMRLVKPLADSGKARAITDGGLLLCEGVPLYPNYPSCDTPDITVGSQKIAACNVGASTAGTGVASYGNYFQRGNNFGFVNTGTVSPASTALIANAQRPYSSGTWIYGSNLSANNYNRTTPQEDNLRGGNAGD
jgi:surface protein